MNASILKLSGSRLPRWLVLPVLLLIIPGGAFCQTAAKPAPDNQQLRTAGSTRAKVSETLIDSSIPNDPRLDQMVAAYSPKVHELDSVIGTLQGGLGKGGVGAGSLGNFVADGMRAQASLISGKPITLALMNAGGMRRSTIEAGSLRVRDIFELLPFENALITVDLTGEQLTKLLQVVVASREAQSGARLVYKSNSDKTTEMETATLRYGDSEKDIDPNATYTVATIDYLYRVGGRYSVLREGKNMRELGITLREAIMNYVRSETAAGREIKPNLDGRFALDRANSAVVEEGRPE